MTKVMEKIVSLLMAPNLDSPVNNQAAQDYKNGTWFNKAKQATQQYAKWCLEFIIISYFLLLIKFDILL